MYHELYKMNIAIFLFAYPVLSETFVINELYQLQEQGINGHIWREKSGDGAHHPKSQKLRFPISNCPEKISSNLPILLRSHLWWLRHHPARYFKLLGEVITRFPDLESLKIFGKAATVAQEVLQSDATHVYVHESDRAYVFGLCAARLCNLPLVVIFHTYYLFAKPRYVSAKVQTADGVIFQSTYSRDLITQRVQPTSEKKRQMHVISSPGIDTQFFAPKKLKHVETNTVQIVSIGRLEEAKGFPHLIDAVAQLKKDGLKVRCRIIGEGSLRKVLEEQIHALCLTQEITLIGSLPHSTALQKELMNAEYFVLPSIQDSDGVHDVHPNAVKEAMAAGLIVLTTQLGGIDEVITDGKDGFIVDDARPETIVQAITQIHNIKLKNKQLIRNSARKKIVDYFEADQITRRLIDCFAHYG